MRRTGSKSGERGETLSLKREAIVTAALRLFSQRGYRKTSIDEIAEAAQVAKRTVYLHFENKEAVFLAILARLVEHIRQRCAVAERDGQTAVERLTALLDAYFGAHLEAFGESQHTPELTEAFRRLARETIEGVQAEYEARLLRCLRSLTESGETGRPPPGLTDKQVVRILLRSASGSKHDPKAESDPKALRSQLRELATLTLAALR